MSGGCQIGVCDVYRPIVADEPAGLTLLDLIEILAPEPSCMQDVGRARMQGADIPGMTTEDVQAELQLLIMRKLIIKMNFDRIGWGRGSDAFQERREEELRDELARRRVKGPARDNPMIGLTWERARRD